MTTQTQTAFEALEFAGRIRMFAEKTRIACQLHLLKKPDDALAAQVMALQDQQEKLIEGAMQDFIRTHPVWTNWGEQVRDLGPMGLSALMSRCDITRLNTLSQMWAHLGFAPGQKLVKGEKANFDVVGRVLAYRVGQRFIRTRKAGKFNAIYYKRKDYEIAHVLASGGSVRPAKKGDTISLPDMSAGHVNQRAIRYMIKTFLACLWIVWREAEGLPVRVPYSAQYPGSDGQLHQGYRPEEFIEVGDPSVAESHQSEEVQLDEDGQDVEDIPT